MRSIRVELSVIACVLAGALLATAGCGPKRTAAASQPTPAAFDPAMSDQDALAAVDAMLAALGGSEAWAQVKQVQWETKYYQNEEFAAWFRHSWDIWNGRHRMESVNMGTYKASQESGNEDDAKWVVAGYDLFDREARSFATFAGKPVMAEDKAKVIADAYQQWQADSYTLAMLYKLRDPGVKLNYVGEIQDIKGRCQPGCVVVKVSFVPEVGSDVYFLNINRDSNMPEVWEKQMGTGTLGYAIEAWNEVGGMRFPAKLVNLGVSEQIEILDVRVGEPDDGLYVPRIER
ncbi:hypothetical protein [Haliangium sp.]|uniref:hypothetical protein n=1 Tax=Haliangium sp. TaxID=2663208 RepID=UPI003D0F96F0